MPNQIPTMKQFLESAKSYIEKGWTQDYYAKTESGRVVEACDEGAVCWCLRGALQRARADVIKTGVEGDGVWTLSSSAERLLEEVGEISHIPRWNDKLGRTQEQVLDLLQKAIDQA
ncbi:hypothetical protein [Myxococcus phage Mx1]|nr:hypothetical protein [Myxococcus phage Mx1]